MLVDAYTFAFVLGGVLVLASIVHGAHDHGADTDAHGGDGHVEPAHGSLEGLLAGLLSLRFWAFFAAFFGLTGLVLDGLDLVDGAIVPLLLATGMGVASGQLAVLVLRRLGDGSTGSAVAVADYLGATGRVLVPFERGTLGKIRVALRGTTVDVLSTTEDDRPFAAGDAALIIEMRDTTAVVSRASDSGEEP